MPQFLVAIHHRDDFDAFAEEDACIGQAIDALNEAMVAAGIRRFVGGLHRYNKAVSIRLNADGTPVTIPGAYLATHEHVGGLSVLEVESLDAAAEWGRKAALACRAPVEVRQFH